MGDMEFVLVTSRDTRGCGEQTYSGWSEVYVFCLAGEHRTIVRGCGVFGGVRMTDARRCDGSCRGVGRVMTRRQLDRVDDRIAPALAQWP